MAPPEPDGVVVACVNLNNHRGVTWQKQRLERLAHQHVAVIAFCEAAAPIDLDGYTCVQGRRDNGQASGEGVLVSDDLRHRRPKVVRAVKGGSGGPGNPISDRDHASVAVQFPFGWVRVWSVHIPPRDYPHTVIGLAGKTLRLALTGRRRWLALGDFNNVRPRADMFMPAAAAHVGGDRIDLVYASPAVASHVVGEWQKPDPDRNDDHPAAVYVRLAGSR